MRALLVLVVLALAAAAAWWWWPTDAAAPETSRLDTLQAQAEQLHALQDHARSERAYALAAEQAAADGDWRRHWAFRAQRAVCLKMLGRTEEARAELLPALEWARANDELATEGLALGNLARVAQMEGDYDRASARMEELVDVAERGGDLDTAVLSLEQIANLGLRRGDVAVAEAWLDRALEIDAQLPEEERRRDALLRQKAWARALSGDDEGAAALWAETPRAPAGDARQAEHLAALGLHAAAAERALAAAQGFAAEDPPRPVERDDALALHVDQLLAAGELEPAAERLAELLGSGGAPAARAPFLVLDGRLAWLRGDLPRAANRFAEARAAAPDTSAAVDAALLGALVLDDLGRADEAAALADTLPANLAGTLVRGWLLRASDEPERLVTDALPALTDFAAAPADRSLQRLRRQSPRVLPTLSWLALHLHLADGDRLRALGRGELREGYVRKGLRTAVRWRMRETVEALEGDWPESARLAGHEQTLEHWLAGEVPTDEAVVMVFTGHDISYMALFTAEWAGTCFGLPPGPDLVGRVAALTETLRSGSLQDTAEAGRRLHRLLFSAKAREDIAGKRLLSFLLPPELSGLPPALLVDEDPVPGMRPTWLVLRRDLRLLAFPPAPPAGPRGTAVLRAGEPQLDPEASRLVVPQLRARFGDGVLSPGTLLERAAGEPRFLRGAELTAGALRAARGDRRWELSVPAGGRGRLGGLLLAPDPAAERVDEQRGVLPWSRLPRLDLPPELLLDRARFDPTDGGPLLAAAAATLGGAEAVLITRWPLPDQPRELLLGEDPGLLFTAAGLSARQRSFLEFAAGTGNEGALHPRAWGAWLLYGGVR